MNTDIQTLRESFIDDENLTIEDIDLNFDSRDRYVDLGLPSKTLWAKCNLGASEPEQYGLYYQWGTIQGYTADDFNWDKETYYEHNDLKYNNFKTMRLKDDAAYVSTNSEAKIPTKAQMQELVNNCAYEWTKINGIRGAKFTGPSGKSIFLPAGGFCDIDGVDYKELFLTYMTSDLYNNDRSDYAYYLYLICQIPTYRKHSTIYRIFYKACFQYYRVFY